MYEKFSVNLVNFRWAVAKISRVQKIVGYKKKRRKIIECIAIGLRHLSVRRPKNVHIAEAITVRAYLFLTMTPEFCMQTVQ